MKKDTYVRFLLGVIAVSLAVLALSSLVNMFTTPAQAQRPYNTVVKEGPAKDVLLIRDIPVEKFEDVHIMGDGQTFVIQKADGFTVYTVENIMRDQ